MMHQPITLDLASFAAETAPRIGLDLEDMENMAEAAMGVSDRLGTYLHAKTPPDLLYVQGQLSLINGLLDALRRAKRRADDQVNAIEEVACKALRRPQ